MLGSYSVNSLRSKQLNILIGGGTGIAFFLLFFGNVLLYPEYISWLLAPNNHDSIQHFVGWEFFRNEPWHFPLGKITNYGYPIATSVVYTDSIPILALFFKLFSPWLPDNFQYFGLWYLLCFFLQGVFAWLLSEYIAKNNIIRFCITLFFLLSPIMLNRMVEHQALVAHWILLAGLLLYIRPYKTNTNFFWLILNTIAVLVHAYLTLMICFFWLAYLVKVSLITKNMTLPEVCKCLFINISTMLFFAWISGYFVISFSGMMSAEGYRFDAMNLLAPFKPSVGSLIAPGGWSLFINSFPSLYIEQETEGFNYFGIGMIMLGILSVISLIKKPTKNTILSPWLPIIFISLLFFGYALSDRIYLGKELLISYNMPEFSVYLTGLFRASGRFFWPVYYFLMFSIFLILSQRIKSYFLVPLFLAALSLQFADLSLKLIELHEWFSVMSEKKETAAFSFLQNQTKLNHYSRIVFLPPVSKPHIHINQFGNYLHYAATHHMSINLGYLARQDNGDFIRKNKLLLAKAFQGYFFNDTIYIILNPRVANRLISRFQAKNSSFKEGDYTILLPKN